MSRPTAPAAMTASAAYLGAAARLTSPPTRPTHPPTPAGIRPPHARPPPAPLLAVLTANLLAAFDVAGRLLVAVSASCLGCLHGHLTALLSRLTSHNAGYVLWSAVLAVLPVPLSAGAEYAVPFPFAGSTNAEEKELSGVSYAMTLYTPTALRRRRKHTVSTPASTHSDVKCTAPLSADRPALTRGHACFCVLRQLVLDLDETLVHTTDIEIPVYDCRVNIHTRRLSRTFYILKRPHLDTFLLTLAPYYHITVFTASIRRYADAVIDLIDPHNAITQRFYRTHCARDEHGQLVKDLSAVTRGRKRTVIVDNSPAAYSRNEENAIPISTWYDEQSDTELRSLIPLLLALRNVDDVRTVLGRRRLLMQS